MQRLEETGPLLEKERFKKPYLIISSLLLVYGTEQRVKERTGRKEHKQGGGVKNIDGRYAGQLFCAISSNSPSLLVSACTAATTFVTALCNMTALYLFSQGFTKAIKKAH